MIIKLSGLSYSTEPISKFDSYILATVTLSIIQLDVDVLMSNGIMPWVY
jgi:hypothetical protein